MRTGNKSKKQKETRVGNKSWKEEMRTGNKSKKQKETCVGNKTER